MPLREGPRYLFVGGPANGQTREVYGDAITHCVLGDAQEPVSYGALTGRTDLPVYEAHRYVRREFRAKVPDGTVSRSAFVSDTIIGSDMLYTLAEYLVARWIIDGEVESDVH